MASFAKQTLTQYNSCFKAWWQFCEEKSYDYRQGTISELIGFLTERYEGNASYSTLNTTRSALSLILGTKVTTHDCVNRFLKGIYRLKPPRPKYNMTWDPNLVLEYLSNYFPYNNISLHDLTLKTITLLALASAQRMQTLSFIKLENITCNNDSIVIKINDIIKNSRPGSYQPIIILPYIQENPKICPALALKTYLDKTQTYRVNKSNNMLFISYKKPHKEVKSQTLGHWVKETLRKSGIDISIFGAHSTRHASTSAAHRSGVSLEVIKKTAGWSDSSNVFLKYYNKEVKTSKNDFFNAIFDSVK